MAYRDHDAKCACQMTDAEIRELEYDIRAKNPHMVIGLPDFSYSVGLWLHNLPELIIHGVGQETAALLINQVAAYMLSTGNVPEHGSVDHHLFTGPTKFLRITESNLREMMARTIPAERAVSDHPYALQIVWPDREGRFPDDPDFSPHFHQHLLG